MDQGLEILADRSGAVVLGWLAPKVLYLNFVGGISGSLGTKCGKRLQHLLATSSGVRCFCNAVSPRNVDFSARSAVVLAFVASRQRLQSVLVLGDSPAVTATAGAVAAVLEGMVEVTADAADFDAKLLRAAPLARLKLRELEVTSMQGSMRWRGSSVPAHV